MFGIYLPKDISRLAEAKYAPLLNKIKDKRRWSSASSVGATLCEHELCFCGISICSRRSQWKPPRRIFIDKIISRFIWQSRRPGVKYKPLQLYKEKRGKRNQGDLQPHFQPSSYCGGSELCISSGRSAAVPVIGALPDLPNLKAYFHAAQIKPLVYCPARWNDIEHSTLKDPPTQASLAHTHLDVHVNMIPNPRIKMKIWDKVKEES